jgi:hypothetical protein
MSSGDAHGFSNSTFMRGGNASNVASYNLQPRYAAIILVERGMRGEVKGSKMSPNRGLAECGEGGAL